MDNFPLLAYMPSDAYNIDVNQVNGRRIAGKLLLQSFASSLQPDEILMVVAPGGQHNGDLANILKPVLPAGARVQLQSALSQATSQAIGTVFRPDPGLSEWVELRAGLPANSFSLTGVIHTLCSRSVLRGIAELVTADLRPWDALICTSQAGRDVVESVLLYKLDQLSRRFGLRLPQIENLLPKLPVIPLPSAIEPSSKPDSSRQQRRVQARQSLGIGEDEFVLASVGRLSFHSKAHPLALYRALSSLIDSAQPIRLIECGHCINEPIARCYRDARSLFPGLSVLEVGGLTPATEEEKRQVLAAADVFVSLSDSIQETFGLSLLEAMDAGLPIIATDWNGYKDLVEHGVSGFLIPCSDAMLDVSELGDPVGQLYTLGVLDYESMLALRSSSVVIDERALRSRVQQLMESSDLRSRMGHAGRHRLEQRFSPSIVSGLYRDLCAELEDSRHSASSDVGLQQPELPFPRFFSGYPSAPLHLERVILAPNASQELALLAMNVPLLKRVPGLQIDAICTRLFDAGSLTRAELLDSGQTPAIASLILAAFVKYGLATAV